MEREFLKQQVKNGNNVIIFGQTGAGKSTLFKELVPCVNQEKSIIFDEAKLPNEFLNIQKLENESDIQVLATCFGTIEKDFCKFKNLKKQTVLVQMEQKDNYRYISEIKIINSENSKKII